MHYNWTLHHSGQLFDAIFFLSDRQINVVELRYSICNQNVTEFKFEVAENEHTRVQVAGNWTYCKYSSRVNVFCYSPSVLYNMYHFILNLLCIFPALNSFLTLLYINVHLYIHWYHFVKKKKVLVFHCTLGFVAKLIFIVPVTVTIMIYSILRTQVTFLPAWLEQ